MKNLLSKILGKREKNTNDGYPLDEKITPIQTNVVSNQSTTNNTPVVNSPQGVQGTVVSLPSSINTTPIRGYTSCQIPVNASFSHSSASTWTYQDPEEIMKLRKKQLMKEYDENPELFSEIIVELRKRKIKQIKDNATQS